jgi:hypothetical protein
LEESKPEPGFQVVQEKTRFQPNNAAWLRTRAAIYDDLDDTKRALATIRIPPNADRRPKRNVRR